MKSIKYEFGLIGLGTMGINLIQNITSQGFTVAGYDKDPAKVDALRKDIPEPKAYPAPGIKEFIEALAQPRIVMLLVPAGQIVDAVIMELHPLLEAGDMIVDLGNSHYTDTDRRIALLSKENIEFMGVGISGGEEGARLGPSIMPGGNTGSYHRMSKMMEAVSAKVNNEPCVAFMGNGSAGHYVKMVHNGIEYGLMQLIAEAYQILKDVSGTSNEELSAVFKEWNEGLLQSFLIKISADIFLQKDDLTDRHLLDKILDGAKQKGTGKWASQDAMELSVPVPVIDAAVAARNLSANRTERLALQNTLHGPTTFNFPGQKVLVDWMESTLYFSMITAYAQGFELLCHASKTYKYQLHLGQIAAIWRGGCIIRSAFLEKIRAAYANNAGLMNIMLDEKISAELNEHQENIRKVIRIANEKGIPVPAISAALAYYDSYRCASLPSNLIQAQRDYFGAHTYQRTDRQGTFHTHWNTKA